MNQYPLQLVSHHSNLVLDSFKIEVNSQLKTIFYKA